MLRLALLQSGSWTSPLCVFDVTAGNVSERFLDQPIVCVRCYGWHCYRAVPGPAHCVCLICYGWHSYRAVPGPAHCVCLMLRLALLQSGSWTSPLCVFDVTAGTVTERFLDQPIVCV